MIARFTASLLAFCIALPLCWCCAETTQTAAESGCCAMMQHESCVETSQPDGQEPHCPCLKHEDSRDTTDTAVAMPAPELKVLGAVIWQETGALPHNASHFPTQNTARHDHGPPGIPPPIYQRHCALLI